MTGTQLTDTQKTSPERLKKVKVAEIVFERQTRKNIFSSYSKSTEFVDTRGNPINKDDIKLQDGWKWISDWKHDGADSWEYSTRWGSTWGPEGTFDLIRRRKWYRYRVKDVTEKELQDLEGEVTIISTDDIIHTEAENYGSGLKKKLLNVSMNTQKPNILLLGASGAGKSSLVNAVFGKTLAQIGEGRPITQTYTKYTSQSSPVVIYDSKGIEHGYVEKGFIQDTKTFFKKLRSEPDLENHIHVVWYVIDLTQARFQPFEADFCRENLKEYPIIFVLNKADAVSLDVRDAMMKAISSFNLPNCRGIFATVANCKNFDTKVCLNCGSGKIRKRLNKGTCTIMCKECKDKRVMEKVSGIDELAKATLDCMPTLVKSVFINSIKDETLAQEIKAKEIILYYSELATLANSDRMAKQLSEMCSKLVALYGIGFISKVLSQAVATRFAKFYLEQKGAKKFLIVLADIIRRASIAQAFVVACGIEVCRAAIAFKNSFVSSTITSAEIKKNDQPNEQTTNGDSSENKISDEKTNGYIEEKKVTLRSTRAKQMEGTKLNGTEQDKELLVEQLLSNIHINVDSHFIKIIANEIKQCGGYVNEFLKRIRIDEQGWTWADNVHKQKKK